MHGSAGAADEQAGSGEGTAVTVNWMSRRMPGRRRRLSWRGRLAASGPARMILGLAALIAAETEPSDWPLGVSVHVLSHGQVVIYAADSDTGIVSAHVQTGDAEALRQAAEAVCRVFTTVSVPGM
jgi:hypothetical protein